MAVLTLAEYKIYKGINSAEADIQNQAIIDAVNTFIEHYCGRVFTGFYDSDKIEYFSATEENLFPIEIPIKQITSLEWSSDNGQTYTNSLVEYTDYIIDIDTDSITSLLGTFCSPNYPQNAIRLTYMGGYDSVPADLSLAATHLAEFYIDSDYTPRKSLAGASVDNVVQPDMTARLPAHIRRVLENYRDIRF